MSVKLSESEQVFWTGTVMTVRNVGSKFMAKQIIQSEDFCCQHDPHPQTFKLELDFGKTKIGFLGAQIKRSVERGDVRRIKITVVDVEGFVLKAKCSDYANNYEWNFAAFNEWAKFYEVANPGAVAWKITCELEYKIFVPSIPNYGSGSSTKQPYFPSDDGLQGDYLKLLQNGNNADVCFSVKGVKIKAHKTILSARSKYFASMFGSRTKENLSGQVEVPDVDPAAFRGLLHFIYGGSAPKNLDNIALDLFVVADKYGLEILKNMCEFHICRNLSTANVVDVLFLAERYNREALMSQAKLVFKGHIRAVERSEELREKLQDDPGFLFRLLVRFVDQ